MSEIYIRNNSPKINVKANEITLLDCKTGTLL